MKTVTFLLLVLLSTQVAYAGTGENITYQVGGQDYDGYYISPAANAPLILLIHDWDGLTDYEVKRAGMLAGEGYAVFAAVVLMALKLLGFVWGILGTLLWLAFLGFVFYILLRVFAPGTADKVKDTIRGEPKV